MTPDDRGWLARAARLALRGHGGAEPNPMVGCLLVDRYGNAVGWGLHRRCGAAHAEVEALRVAGRKARGATAYVTLEPCNHTGRTGPCAEALIEAGVARCVIGASDPNPTARGGAARLGEAGVEVVLLDDMPAVRRLNAPHLHRVATGLPWVIAKWAQTLDGRVATRTGASKWISAERSRRMVHRERGRVDAIVTGIGTARADDPLLTARGVRLRRVARRVVVDRDLDIRRGSRLVQTARQAPTLVAHRPGIPAARAAALRGAGVDLLELPERDGRLDLRALLAALASRHGASNVLVEAGPGLLGSFLEGGLVNTAWAFIAPMVLGDDQAVPAAAGRAAADLAGAIALDVHDVRRIGPDVMIVADVRARSRPG